MKSTRFTELLNFEKELKSTVWGREFQQLITRSQKIGTYAANGLALVEFKFMTTSVLAGDINKQVIKINTNQTKNTCANLHRNWLIRFQNIVFTCLITNERTGKKHGGIIITVVY